MSWLARVLRLGPAGCPPGWKLTRAVSEGLGDPAIDAHVRGCARCWAEAEGLAAVLMHGQDLPAPEGMTTASRQAISVTLLTAGGNPAPRRRIGRVLVVAGVAVGAIALLLFARRARLPIAPAPAPVVAEGRSLAPAPGRSRAAIRAIGGARFSRVQSAPDDVVLLDEGSLVFEVAPLPAGERFRVRTADAEVEVRGTRFRVSAARGELVAVYVTEGRVEVRSPGGGHALLEAGDEWVRGTGEAPAAAAATPVAKAPRRPAPERAPAPSEARAVANEPTARASFDRAWALLRQGDARGAAALFAEVEALAAGRGIAEDALYWRAVATARAGEARPAVTLLGDFLSRFPASSRRGEAATALGWLLLEAGDPSAARAAFERAAEDPSPTVRASARDGLRRATADR
jgi:hypothetical protein